MTELKADLARLQDTLKQQTANQQALHGDIEANAAAYQAITGAISGKLQIGTTPGNPGIVQAWQQAQQNLNSVETDIGQMNALSNEVAGNAAYVAFLQDSVRAAFGVSGAVDEDHRQLRRLQDQVAQTNVDVDRLLSLISQDVARQNEVSGDRAEQSDGAGERRQQGRLHRHHAGQQHHSDAGAADAAARRRCRQRPSAGHHPLRPPNVNYEQALYQAARKALEIRPNAAFDVVGVAPASGAAAQVALNGDIARTNADRVVRSLLTMGLPADRVSTSQTNDPNVQANEVRIYVR